MQVEVKIQGRPEALYEGNGAALRFPHGAKLASSPDRENAKDIGNHAGVVSQPVAEGVRKREHPLPDRDMWKDAVDQVRRCLRHYLMAAPYRACIRSAHAASTATTADTSLFARVRQKAVQSAVIAVETNKTPHEYATVDKRTKFALDERRHMLVPLALSGEERFQMSGDNFIERALFGIAGPVSGVDSHAGGNECNLPRKPDHRPHSNIRPAIFWKS